MEIEGGEELERAQERKLYLEEVRLEQSGRGNSPCKGWVTGQNLMSEEQQRGHGGWRELGPSGRAWEGEFRFPWDGLYWVGLPSPQRSQAALDKDIHTGEITGHACSAPGGAQGQGMPSILALEGVSTLSALIETVTSIRRAPWLLLEGVPHTLIGRGCPHLEKG